MKIILFILQLAIILIGFYLIYQAISFLFPPLVIQNEHKLTAKEFFLQEKVKEVNVSAYTARVEETDDTPCETAYGKNACNPKVKIVANNCLNKGVKVRIAGEIYEVWDKMNKRYGCNYFDILMPTVKDALNFGRQILLVEVLDK